MFKKYFFFYAGFVQLVIFAIPMIVHCISDNTIYRELNDYIYLWLPILLGCLLALLQIYMIKICFPNQYDYYREWTSRGKDHSSIYFLLIAIGYFLSIFLVINYSDQYHVYTPIKSYEFSAYSRYKSHGRHSYSYYTVFVSPQWGEYKVSGQEYYDTVKRGDFLTVYLREGRFHTYFVVDEKLHKPFHDGFINKNFLSQFDSDYRFNLQDNKFNVM